MVSFSPKKEGEREKKGDFCKLKGFLIPVLLLKEEEKEKGLKSVEIYRVR